MSTQNALSGIRRGIVGMVALLCLAAVWPLQARAADAAYQLQAGDLLHLQVLNPGFEDLAGDLVVQQDGRVKLPVKPPATIMAAGLTLNQFETAAQKAFGGFIRDPAITITLKTARILNIYVLGACTKDGAFPMQGPLKALDAVALAGGAPKGDLSQAVLTRGHTSRMLDLQSAQSRGSSAANVELQPDDILFIPEMRSHITVQGEVMNPQNLPFKQGMSMEEALAAAGGPTKKADISKILIGSVGGKETRINLFDLMKTGAPDQTVLQPDDIITVPEETDRVLVLGEVVHPQAIQYRPDLTLDDALVEADGATPRADLRHVKLARLDSKGIETIDVERALRDGKATPLPLQPGDVITIPQLTDQVFVLGAVTRPGPVPFRSGMTLLEALSGPGDAANPSLEGAGGPTKDANLYDATLTHQDGKVIDIDLDKMLRGGDSSQNIVLEPGDSLYVPVSKRQVYVFGAVLKPGAYVLPENDKNRILDALQLAGGPTDAAIIHDAQLLRPGKGKIDATPIHLDRLLRKGELQYNLPLMPGDVIYIPQHGQSTFLQNIAPGLLYTLLPFLTRL